MKFKSHSNRAVASIIGGVFLILIILSAYAFFVMSNKETNDLQSTIKTMNTADDNKKQENIILSNIFLARASDGTYLRMPDGSYILKINISNQGQADVNITYIGYYEEQSNNPYTFTKIRPTTGVVGLVISPEQSREQDINVPDTTGNFQIKAISDKGNILTATYPFVSQSTTSISLVQTNGGQGESVILSGSGFTKDSPISIEFDQKPISIGPIEGFTVGGMASPVLSTTPPSGAAVGVAFHDSATLSGATVDAGGSVTYTLYSGTYPTGTLVDSDTETVTNGVVPNSKDFTEAAGSYYFTVSYSGDANNEQVQPPTVTDSSGKFSTSFNVPIPSTIGAHSVKATDGNLFFASTTYTHILATLTMNPANGLVNTNIPVQITGSGYLPNSPVIVTMNGNTLCTVKSDQYGSINSSPITINYAIAGPETVTATDGGQNIGSAIFTFS